MVFGATGKTGIHICHELESKSIPYTVFVREKSSNLVLQSAIKKKHGDVLNSQKVEFRFQNKNFTDVIIALGSKDLKNSKIRSLGTKNNLNAKTEDFYRIIYFWNHLHGSEYFNGQKKNLRELYA